MASELLREQGEREFSELKSSGLLWLMNRTVFHPRGFALAFVFDPNISTEPLAWKLLGDGITPWEMGDTDEEAQEYLAKINALLAPHKGETAGEAPGVNEMAYKKIVDSHLENESGYCRDERCPVHGAILPPTEKVGIELTGNEWQLIQNLLYENREYELGQKIIPFITPPLEEPKEYVWLEAEVWMLGEWEKFRFYGPFPRTDAKKWICEANLEPYRWNELRNVTRIGGEK